MTEQGFLGTVAVLRRYPVKSMLGENLRACAVTGRGLTGDRVLGLVHRESVQIDVPETLDISNRSRCRSWVASLPRKWSIRYTCCSSSTEWTIRSSSLKSLPEVPNGFS